MADRLLLEDGVSHLLLETADAILLETSTVGSTYTIMADPGTYAITGVDADLTYATLSTGRLLLDAGTGAILLENGNGILLETSGVSSGAYTITADPGTYVIGGTDAALTYSGAAITGHVFAVGPGVYTLSGAAATVRFSGTSGGGGGAFHVFQGGVFS